MIDHVEGAGTREDPWILVTPVGTSEFDVWRDEELRPPGALGARGVDDVELSAPVHRGPPRDAVERGDWMLLGNADEQKEAKPGTVEAWARSADNPVGGWYGLRKGYRGRFATYVPPVLEHLGLAEVEHNPRNNRMRAV